MITLSDLKAHISCFFKVTPFSRASLWKDTLFKGFKNFANPIEYSDIRRHEISFVKMYKVNYKSNLNCSYCSCQFAPLIQPNI